MKKFIIGILIGFVAIFCLNEISDKKGQLSSSVLTVTEQYADDEFFHCGHKLTIILCELSIFQTHFFEQFYFISFRPSMSANTRICWMAIRFNFNKRSC